MGFGTGNPIRYCITNWGMDRDPNPTGMPIESRDSGSRLRIRKWSGTGKANSTVASKRRFYLRFTLDPGIASIIKLGLDAEMNRME